MTLPLRHTPLNNHTRDELVAEHCRAYDPLITSDLEVELAAAVEALIGSDELLDAWLEAAGENTVGDVAAICNSLDDTEIMAEDAAEMIALLHEHDIKSASKLESLLKAIGAIQDLAT